MSALDLPAFRVENDARKNNVDDSWDVISASSDNFYAMVFHNDDNLHRYIDIYVNQPGFSFGYSFRSGISTSEDVGGNDNVITKFTLDSFEFDDYVLMSFNQLNATKMVVDDGLTETTYDIDPTAPFVFILPHNSGAITFYDINDNILDFEIITQPL